MTNRQQQINLNVISLRVKWRPVSVQQTPYILYGKTTDLGILKAWHLQRVYTPFKHPIYTWCDDSGTVIQIMAINIKNCNYFRINNNFIDKQKLLFDLRI